MIDIVRATRQAVEQRMSLSDFDMILDQIASGGSPSYSGKLVSPRNAMGIPTVWACVTTLADDFAALPLPTYSWLPGQEGKARQEERDHYLWHLFMEEANPRMSSFEFKQVMETWRWLWGNCYAEMEINGRGQITALWPWRPDRVKVMVENPSDPRSKVWYVYVPLDYSMDPIPVPADRMLHVRNVSLDGIIGLSPIEVHRQTAGLSLAQQESAGRFYGNGMVVKGTLEHPGRLGEKGLLSLQKSMEQYQGLQNSHRLLILEEGMKYKDIGVKMADAQWIESNKLTDQQIARIYKVPGHKIGLMDAATNNNIEQLSIDYVAGTQMPNCAAWTGRIHCSMLSARDISRIFVEPKFKQLMMADSQARAAYYNALRWVLPPDLILEAEGFNPLPNSLGALPRVPLNTAPMDSEIAKTGDANASAPEDVKGGPKS